MVSFLLLVSLELNQVNKLFALCFFLFEMPMYVYEAKWNSCFPDLKCCIIIYFCGCILVFVLTVLLIGSSSYFILAILMPCWCKLVHIFLIYVADYSALSNSSKNFMRIEGSGRKENSLINPWYIIY